MKKTGQQEGQDPIKVSAPVVDATPAQPIKDISSDDDKAWKVVTRRSRERARG